MSSDLIIYTHEHAEILLDESLFDSIDDLVCLGVKKNGSNKSITLGYYIGVDWIKLREKALYVAPKLNKETLQTDYLKMLFGCLKHSEVFLHTKGLYEIKFEEPHIEIEQKQDMLTPLLIIQFLQILRIIVRKGLKKSYYKVEQNFNSKIKGKILVDKTIKHNILNNKQLKTYCSYNEFGFDGLENRLLKKTLLFIQRYLAGYAGLTVDVNEVMNYCSPAFESVSDRIDVSEIKYSKVNAFYKEYEEAIRLAKLILKRFDYNIHTIEKNLKVKVPPFWIDMSKLFELYVLGLLKDRFGNHLKYQFTKRWNELDYLLNSPDYKMVVDAKYKEIYQNSYDLDNIRQLSGYARISAVVKELEFDPNKVVDCLIIYPDQNASENIKDRDLKHSMINGFINFYKMPVKLPVIKSE